MTAPNPFVNEEGALVNVVLSGEALPEGLEQRSDVVLDSHSGRFATVAVGVQGLAWLVAQDTVEWVEPRPVFELLNSVGIEVMERRRHLGQHEHGEHRCFVDRPER